MSESQTRDIHLDIHTDTGPPPNIHTRATPRSAIGQCCRWFSEIPRDSITRLLPQQKGGSVAG